MQKKDALIYVNESATHPNWFDASYISWENYDSLNIELPDGYQIAKVFELVRKEC